MNIKARLLSFAIPLALLGMASCAKNDVEHEPSAEQTKKAEQIIEVDLKLEATASMELDSEARAAGGALQLDYNKRTPLFRILDKDLNGDSVSLKAHCVFKPLKQGSTTELDDTRALYGDVYFKRKKDSEPSIKDSKAVAVELISDGKVTLRGTTSIKKGEQWYVMGIVGGKTQDGKNISINGITVGIEEEGGTASGLDIVEEKGGGSVPFLSRWTKLAPAKDENVVTSNNQIHFKFQGMLFNVEIQNGTDYRLRPKYLIVQSTELTRTVSYDLSSSNNINDTEANVSWENTGQVDAEKRWYISSMRLFAQRSDNSYALEYKLDPKSQAENGNYMYDPQKSKLPVSVIFWANTTAVTKSPEGTINKGQDLPYRTGFFLSTEHLEAKPITAGPSTSYKYVLSNDPQVDDILGSTSSTLSKSYASNIKMAPSMDYVCVKTVQRSLKNNQGKYVHTALTVPARPVLPIETIAQNNLYDPKNGTTGAIFTSLSSNTSYTQYTTYAKELDNASSDSYWMLPTKEQWFGVLLAGHNRDKAHNWNTGVPGLYGWVEEKGSAGPEPLTLSDGTQKQFYMIYGRPTQGHRNQNTIYALRNFTNQENTKGSEYFSVTKYLLHTENNLPYLRVQTAWLGPEYAKLYEGIFADNKSWIREIADNDDGGNQASMFYHLQKDFITRDFIVDPRGTKAPYYRNFSKAAGDIGFSPRMTAYYFGPASSFDNYNATGLAFNNNVLMTGYSESVQMDFTQLRSIETPLLQRQRVEAYLRPMRRNFIKFQTNP